MEACKAAIAEKQFLRGKELLQKAKNLLKNNTSEQISELQKKISAAEISDQTSNRNLKTVGSTLMEQSKEAFAAEHWAEGIRLADEAAEVFERARDDKLLKQARTSKRLVVLSFLDCCYSLLFSLSIFVASILVSLTVCV